MSDKVDSIVYAKCCTNINQLYQLTNSSSNDINRMSFFYNPPGDNQIYHITCKLLLNENDDDTLSDHAFNYQLDDKNHYQINCILISPSLIVQFLNKKMYGIELRQTEEPQQEFLTFSNGQRDNLEFHLKEFLFNHLAPKQINKKPKVNVLTSSDADNKIISQPKL
ncbi:hypothetical protein C1645_822151 [Glomus cerebriforme]|uniref:Uncharacterized protein n=1 Tax=Glomus cerebriforme TaxID=658196 RepID=A0A397SYT3_9GLOM|nr:hypothetical protein C1645_822151 [Glomus cerebriforme]